MIVSTFSKGKIVSDFKSGSKENSMSKNKKSAWWLSSISSSTPALVTDYETRVIAEGGSLQAGDKALLTTFYNTPGISAILAKVEVGFFMGGFAGSLVKFNYLDANYKTLLNDGGAAFVSGDYTENIGIKKISGAKRLNVGFNPANVGSTISDFSFGVCMADAVFTNGNFGGLNPASGAVPINLSTVIISKNNLPSGAQSITPVPMPKIGDYTWRWASAESGWFNGGWDYNYFFPINQSASSNFDLNNYYSLFTVNNNGLNGFGAISFYYAGRGLTYSEIVTLQKAAEVVMRAKGRISNGAHCVNFGDSITNGVGATVYTNRYSYILAGYHGLMEKNCGINGSRLTVDFATVPGGYQRRAILANYNIAKLNIIYGTNDMVFRDVTTDGDATILSDYQAKFEQLIDYANATLGVSLSNITISGPPLLNNGTNTTKQAAYRDKALAAAQSRHVKFADNYQYMTDNGGVATNVSADNLHPSNTGHANIAFNMYNNAIQY